MTNLGGELHVYEFFGNDGGTLGVLAGSGGSGSGGRGLLHILLRCGRINALA